MRDMADKGRDKWHGKCKRGHDMAVHRVPTNKGTGYRCGKCLTAYREGRRRVSL